MYDNDYADDYAEAYDEARAVARYCNAVGGENPEEDMGVCTDGN